MKDGDLIGGFMATLLKSGFHSSAKTYLETHRDPANLFLHFLSAPVFAFGVLTLLTGLAVKSMMLTLISAAVILLTLFIQAYGHSKETDEPQSTRSMVYFLSEFFFENTVLFWKFVFSADFAPALKKMRAKPRL
jgi:hypothetical protein